MAPAAQPPPPQSPELRAADSLLSALLLSFTGGGLDAFTYLNHGKVFAGAMTGNAVLLGIAALRGDPRESLLYLLQLLAFFAGVWTAKALESHLKQHAVAAGLACEILTLFAASWLPGGFPDLVFVPVISLTAAYQVASFRLADEYAYNSTFITANLRSAVLGLYDARNPAHRARGLRRFRDLSLVVCGFAAGAVTGAASAPRLLNHTLWLLDLPLIAVLALAIRRDKQAQPAGEKRGDLETGSEGSSGS